ncbi:cupredoxin domain-containing protein [Glaciecola sp. 1036]|uniref:cupredoxin domain-containing protein n=1 Tax=Alteromonadaceae TaxID=72275 RepID=UPI003D060CAF
MGSIKPFSTIYSCITLLLLTASSLALAELKVFTLTLENHVFTPQEIQIPANQKVKLVIENKDDLAEEFDSFDLNRERVIFANKKASIYIGPLEPGRYEFFGEFNPHTARGYVVVKEENKDD